MAGVLQPTKGSVSVDGRLSALLELGSGFNPEFTGRENAMMNGQILGMNRKEMKERMPEIEQFAGIGEFIDQPVKTYSSGMRVRLAFSVALFVDPEVLLVDEALSVGDAEFKHVGMNRVRELKESGKTIVFVSHSASMLQSLCNEAILLENGRILQRGNPSEVVDQYRALINPQGLKGKKREIGEAEMNDEFDEQDFKVNSGLEDRHETLRRGSGEVQIRSVELLNAADEPVPVVGFGDEMTIRVHLEYLEDVERSNVQVVVRDKAGLDIFGASSSVQSDDMKNRSAGDRLIVNFKQPTYLRPGTYSIVAGVMRGGSKETLDWVNVAQVFEVDRPVPRRAFPGLVGLPTEVEVLEVGRAESSRETA
jgi:ABC-type multidrug transport system ATPase subunit